MSKGSAPRPLSVSKREFDDRFERTFGVATVLGCGHRLTWIQDPGLHSEAWCRECMTWTEVVEVGS